ncbi:MAG: heavy-metal-associated domain-containing protein, partial [Candidatus Eiseniibacteriota bacterium]
LCMATTSWAGGSSCSSEKVSEGSHCTMKSSNASAHEACTVKANQTVYSFTVPSVECEKCIETIQKAAMANAGIACAHVDLATHTAYIIADKKMSQKDIAKIITDAGYKNKFTGSGQKVQAEFAKALAAGDKGINCCAKGTKDKA